MMFVRLLTENDRNAALAFLDRDHEINLVMIFDIETFGIENRGLLFQGDYFGAFLDGELHGVACLYNFGSLWIHAPRPPAAEALARRLAGLDRPPGYLIARTAAALTVLEALGERGVRPARVEEQKYMALTREGFRPWPHDPRARPARPEDLPSLLELGREFQVEYFGRFTEAEEEMGRMARERMAEEGIAVSVSGGRVVSKAEVMVRTARMASIGGVYTRPAYRRRGLAAGCMTLLCERVLRKRERVCLNVAVENRAALGLYRGLGFREMCETRMVLFTA